MAGTFTVTSAIEASFPPDSPLIARGLMPRALATSRAFTTFFELPEVESPTTRSFSLPSAKTSCAKTSSGSTSFAKAERDAQIAEINKEYIKSGGIGSGYPSDPTTKQFLTNYTYDEMPEFVRKSWATVSKLKDVQTTLI